jgi:DNA-binding transcriptional MerR regulator
MTERNGRSGGRTTVDEEDVAVADVDLGLPDRKYFKIGEVASLLGVEAHVLRYWETQFPQLKPHKARSGHRLYRRREVETLLVIKDLLHVQRFTIAGARQALRQQGTTSLLPRAAEQLTLPPTPTLQARHSRVLESTIPTEAGDDDDDFTDEGDAIDGDGSEVDDDVLELHLADPLPRTGARDDEVEVEIVAADGDALEEALARQLARQKNPQATVVPVEVRARSQSSATTSLPSSAGRTAARTALMAAKADLEAFLSRANKQPDGHGRARA